MAEVGSQWFNPFDPQDPDALASAAVGVNPERYAAQVATRPASRLAIYRKPVQALDPQQQISGEFGALGVEDRSQPGYPDPTGFLYSGSSFDPTERRFMRIPEQTGGYYLNENRPPSIEDYRNPISLQAGLLNVGPAAERIHQAAQKDVIARKIEEDANFEAYERDRLQREAAQRELMQKYNDRLRQRRREPEIGP